MHLVTNTEHVHISWYKKIPFKIYIVQLYDLNGFVTRPTNVEGDVLETEGGEPGGGERGAREEHEQEQLHPPHEHVREPARGEKCNIVVEATPSL